MAEVRNIFEGEETLRFLPSEKRRAMFRVAIDMLAWANGPLKPQEAVEAVSEFINKVSGYGIPKEWMQFVVEAWNELDVAMPGKVDPERFGAEVIKLYEKGGAPPDLVS